MPDTGIDTGTSSGPARAPARKPAHNGNLSLALDFGPLLVFFLAYKFWGMIVGTGAFMAAIAVAVVVSKVKLAACHRCCGCRRC